MKKFDDENFDKWQLCELRQICVYDLCILRLFSLLTITVGGVSNKHCLLPFFIASVHNKYQQWGWATSYTNISYSPEIVNSMLNTCK